MTEHAVNRYVLKGDSRKCLNCNRLKAPISSFQVTAKTLIWLCDDCVIEAIRDANIALKIRDALLELKLLK